MCFDKRTEENTKDLYPDFRARLFRVLTDMYEKTGYKMSVTSGYRSYQSQKELWDQGRNKPGSVVTNAKPGESFHNFGLAADCCFISKDDPYLEKHPDKDKLWARYGEIANLHGLRWGGSLTKLVDLPHVECAYQTDLDQLQIMHEHGGMKLVFFQMDKLVYNKTA